MICNVCGTRNDDQARFCLKCGDNLKKQKKELYRPSERNTDKRRANPRQAIYRKALLIGACTFLVISITLLLDQKKKNEPSAEQITEEKSNNPAIELKVREIASQFVCTCGSCNEESLEVCSCNRAIQERQLIRDYITEGQKADQIIKIVNTNYGGLKIRLKEERQRDKEAYQKLDLNLPLNGNAFNSTSGSPSIRIATQADFDEIVGQFQCNCGKCEIDNLKDCRCSHPKGAGEVKAFIYDKIAEGKYTVEQVIEIVDKTYGGKKL